MVSGAVLALVLIDLRHVARADEATGDAARAKLAAKASAVAELEGIGHDEDDVMSYHDGPGGRARGGEVSTDSGSDADGAGQSGGHGSSAARRRSVRMARRAEDRWYEPTLFGDRLGAFGSVVSVRTFWLPKVLLGVCIFAAAISLNARLFQTMRTDPGATYTTVDGVYFWFYIEGALAIVWLAYALQLGLNGIHLAEVEQETLKLEAEAGELPMDGSISQLSMGYLATAFSFVLCICAIHMREIVRTRVADHPWYSDSAFKTQVQNLLVANALGVGLAICFRPSSHSFRVQQAGGLRAALEHGHAGFAGLKDALSVFAVEMREKVSRTKARAAAAAPLAKVNLNSFKQHVPRFSGGRASRSASPASAHARVDAAPPAPTNRSSTESGSDGLARASTQPATPPARQHAPKGVRKGLRGGPKGGQLRPTTHASVLDATMLEKADDTNGHVLLSTFLRTYARRLRRAYACADTVDAASLDELRSLQELLSLLPQTARHVNYLKWRYPLFFSSRQTYLWAVLLKDVDTPNGRAFWCDKHPQLAAALNAPLPPGVPPASPAALVTHLRSLGLDLESTPIEATTGPHVLVLIRNSAAVRAEHVRAHAARCRVELELTVRVQQPFSAADKVRAISRLLTEHPMPGQSHAALEPGALSLRAGELELVAGSFPLHDRELNTVLHAELRKVYVLSNEQLTVLRNHYGEEVAFYYALLNFTCTWLSPIAALGLLFLLLQYSDAERIYDLLYIAFASICVIWSALVYVFWRRKAAELALLWDVSSLHDAQDRNPHFKGKLVHDEIHGVRPYAAPWSRPPAFMLTAFHMVIQMAVLVVLEYCVYAHWVWLNEKYDRPDTFAVYFLHSFVLNALLYILLIMYGQYIVWAWVAKYITHKENWESMCARCKPCGSACWRHATRETWQWGAGKDGKAVSEAVHRQACFSRPNHSPPSGPSAHHATN